MTTHYEKIQALGNRMASNLETMGVSASFGDGGLTLSDKILEIQHFTDGLLLWADKDIIQTGDTVNFCALLLDDKKGVSGETIVFYDSNSVPISYDTSGIHTINKNLGKSFMVHYEGDTELQFGDESNTGYSLVYKANKSLEITSSGSSQITWNNVEWVKMVNGVLSDNNGNSFDLSSLVTNVILMHLVGTGSVYFDVVGVGVTGSNGVATVSYTGKGTGKLNIQAYDPVRIISSETYSIWDTLWYDLATSEDTTKWNNFGATASYSSDNGTTLSQDTDYRYQAKYDITEDIIIDFEVKIPSTSTGNPNLYVKGMAPHFGANPFTRDVWHRIIITCSDGAYTMYKDTISEQTKVVEGNYVIANKIFQFRVTNSELSFKNFKIYPI